MPTNIRTNKAFPIAESDVANLTSDLASKQASLGFTPVPDTRTVNGHALSSDVTITKSDIGLGNVVNLDTSNPANITQDSTHRFATDAEKSTWNGKQAALGFTPENSANKDATGGYAGLTLFKINFKNALNTFTSFFTNSNTAARTYTFPDYDGNIVVNNRETAGDTNFTFGTGKNIAALTVAYTAPRTVTLPAANSFSAGERIYFIDTIGGITYTNTATFTRAGSDTINGATTIVGNSTNGVYEFVSDGSSKWTTNILVSYSEGTWVPTWTGFSADPTSVVATYIIVGKMCTITINCAAGTSNATTKTVTAPFTSANISTFWRAAVVASNSGTNLTTPAMARMAQNTNTITLFKDYANGAWTNTGGCLIDFTLTYQLP